MAGRFDCCPMLSLSASVCATLVMCHLGTCPLLAGLSVTTCFHFMPEYMPCLLSSGWLVIDCHMPLPYVYAYPLLAGLTFASCFHYVPQYTSYNIICAMFVHTHCLLARHLPHASNLCPGMCHMFAHPWLAIVCHKLLPYTL